MTYEWKLDNEVVSKDKNFTYTFDTNGTYKLVLKASQENLSYEYAYTITVKENLYTLQKEDITITVPEAGFEAIVDQLFKVEVKTVSDEGVTYEWFLDEASVSTQKEFEYMFNSRGTYDLVLVATQNGSVATRSTLQFEFPFTVVVKFDGEAPTPPEGSTAYITQVFDFVPAIGQFTNTMPQYKEGDTQEIMNQKYWRLLAITKKA